MGMVYTNGKIKKGKKKKPVVEGCQDRMMIEGGMKNERRDEGGESLTHC